MKQEEEQPTTGFMLIKHEIDCGGGSGDSRGFLSVLITRPILF